MTCTEFMYDQTLEKFIYFIFFNLISLHTLNLPIQFDSVSEEVFLSFFFTFPV